MTSYFYHHQTHPYNITTSHSPTHTLPSSHNTPTPSNPLHHHTTHHTIKPSPSHNTPTPSNPLSQHTHTTTTSAHPQDHTHTTTPSPSMICAAAMKGSWQPSTDLAKELHTPMGMIPMRVWAVTGMKRDFLRLTPALFWV